ncbi:MAG: alpha-ketoacid dehydrogenase subunit beta [Nitrospinota bacterium]
MKREITFSQAILECTDQYLANDPSVYVMGLGVPDPKGIFGTTVGLREKYGEKRVMDMPVSENGMTGVAIGSALMGMRPIMTHQRIDFMLLSLDQIINNAAKWYYMFGGKKSVPLVIRLLVGQGWGQGPQHSQSLQTLFSHIPGLKVVFPFSPYDAKGLLSASIQDDNPVIFIEHRWLHNLHGHVPEEPFQAPIGKAKVVNKGKDLTIVSGSYMMVESLKASECLKENGIEVEVIDLRSIKPLDEDTIIQSVMNTGHLLVVDGAWRFLSISAEIISIVVEKAFKYLKKPPGRVTFPDVPTPTSWAMANNFYPRAINILRKVEEILDLPCKSEEEWGIVTTGPLDVPDKSFTGPF